MCEMVIENDTLQDCVTYSAMGLFLVCQEHYTHQRKLIGSDMLCHWFIHLIPLGMTVLVVHHISLHLTEMPGFKQTFFQVGGVIQRNKKWKDMQHVKAVEIKHAYHLATKHIETSQHIITRSFDCTGKVKGVTLGTWDTVLLGKKNTEE